MKMNKLAAGALALALGLGAVAPAVAAEEKTAVKSELTSYEIFLQRHNDLVKEINEIIDFNKDVKAKRDAADAELEKAQARYEAALDAYQAQFPGVKVKDGDKVLTVAELAEKPVEEAMDKVALYFVEGLNRDRIQTSIDYGEDRTVTDTAVALFKVAKVEFGKEDVDYEAKEEDATLALVQAIKAINYANEKKNDKAALSAYAEYEAAKANLNAAQVKRDEVYKNNEPKDLDTKLTELKNAAEGYGFSVQVGNAGLKITDEKIEQEEEFDLKELAAAREKAVTTLEAVKLLEELAPEKIADVKEELDKLVAEQKDLIKLADKYLDKEIALFSTAYAAEDDEEMSAEELTDKLNEKSDKIQDLIKDEEKPAEDDKEDEEKPAEDDKEDDEKPAEDDKDDKEDEEKPAENKPSKGAGNNAKTGIAGVAGVAGILAAASVAYAASKRD